MVILFIGVFFKMSNNPFTLFFQGLIAPFSCKLKMHENKKKTHHHQHRMCQVFRQSIYQHKPFEL